MGVIGGTNSKVREANCTDILEPLEGQWIALMSGGVSALCERIGNSGGWFHQIDRKKVNIIKRKPGFEWVVYACGGM